MGFFWYLGSRYKYTFAHDVCCELYIPFSGAKTDIVEVNLGIKKNLATFCIFFKCIYVSTVFFTFMLRVSSSNQCFV